MVGLLAGLCLSAKAPFVGKEIAMSKCSKDKNSSESQDNSNGGCADCDCGEQSDASSEMKIPGDATAETAAQTEE